MKTYDDFIEKYGKCHNSVIYTDEGKVIIDTSNEYVYVTNIDNPRTTRFDGPVYIWNKKDQNGKCIVEWWINGHHVTTKIIQWAKENDIDLDNLSDVDKALIKIVWADYGK